MRPRTLRFLLPPGLAGLALALMATAAAPAHAESFATDWAHGAKSQARLIAAGPDLAALEIRLAPGAITYWRDPGDAGVPPVFDTSASVNVASVEPLFPAPRRIAESDGSQAFGYEGSVVIPFRVKPADPGKPVALTLDAQFGVCEKICLPARAKLSLALPAGGGSSYAGMIEAALAAAPRPISAKDLGVIVPAGVDAWRFCASGAAEKPRDLFVEPPLGWWITSAPAPDDKGGDCFKLTLRQQPKDANPPVALRLTMTGGAGPVEAALTAPALK